jgi:hypothetical protein
MSSVVYFNFSRGAPRSLATAHEFTASSSSGTGTFTIDFVRVQCGMYYVDLAPFSPSYIYTTIFNGYVFANEDCAAAFVGRCVGTPLGGGNCTRSLSGWTGIVWW